MLGLGTSIGTPAEGITAEVVVVTSFEELDKIQNDAKGKIVLFNQPWTSYGEVSQYRYGAASAAAKYGAVAALVCSLRRRCRNDGKNDKTRTTSHSNT